MGANEDNYRRGDPAHAKSGSRVCFHSRSCQRRNERLVSCPVCMCRWIVAGAAALDAALGLQPALSIPSGVASKLDVARVSAILGLEELLCVLSLCQGAAIALVEDLEELGAISVKEPTFAEWECLGVWAVLKPLQRRRLMQQLGL